MMRKQYRLGLLNNTKLCRDGARGCAYSRAGNYTAKRGAGLVEEDRPAADACFEKLDETVVPEGTMGDELLGRHAPSIGPARLALLRA